MKNESRKCFTIDSDKGQLESNDSFESIFGMSLFRLVSLMRCQTAEEK